MKKTTRSLLSALGCTDRELSILLTDDAEIQFLNAHYRKKNKPTDVLAFVQDEEELLGDVVISVETAKRQAKLYRVTLRAELTRLIVHGTLHLLGYRHENVSKRTAARMWKKEAELLAEL